MALKLLKLPSTILKNSKVYDFIIKPNTKAMIRNSKHLGFSERRRPVRAFIEKMPNPSLSCEPKFSSKLYRVLPLQRYGIGRCPVPVSAEHIRI